LTQLVVNGERRAINAAPRAHLADVLREELLLTGTHIGCEHGVCGACTVLIDDQPARACLTFPALCDGASVRTIEGLDDDPTILALRAAFKAEHALQCGYCTPGMLVTARDIVLRLPGADEARVRLELAGNLCRCTGYQGIVGAILSVLANPPQMAPAAAPLPVRPAADTTIARDRAAPPSAPAQASAPGGRTLKLKQPFTLSPDALWAALQDPALLVSCVPGATLTDRQGEALRGELQAGLGPIRTRFAGEGHLRYDAATRAGTLQGDGLDRLSATRVRGLMTFRVTPADGGSVLEIEAEYDLRGPLAQLARPAIVSAFAAELIASFARRLEAALGAEPRAARATGGWTAAWRWLFRMLGRNHV
jgi:carbon-monoxide dehydrogenase small subunit